MQPEVEKCPGSEPVQELHKNDRSKNENLRNMLVQSNIDTMPFELTSDKPLVILSLCG